MPIVPMTDSETTLTCLLRVFSIRRDVTSFFRGIWKPLLPAALAVLNVDDSTSAATEGPHVFANLVSIANRLIVCFFREKTAVSMPAIVIAVCQTVFDIGGFDALCNYLFHLLVLPNLIKVLAGDHDSAENEDIYRMEDAVVLVNKYYDHKFWCDMSFHPAHYPPEKVLIIIFSI